MESDTVRTIGDNIAVDMWVGGQFRSISVPPEAITGFRRLSGGPAAAFSDEELREFVRRHLRLVAAAAEDALHDMPPNAAAITVDAELLQRHGKPAVEPRSAAGG